MAEEVAIIKIIPDGVAPGSSRGTGSAIGGGLDIGKGLLNGLKSLFATIGVGSLILMVAKIVSSIQSLQSIIGAILKSIGLLLKPIADVITVLLMPILAVLKPIIMAVNQFMQPFIKLAMEAFREGAKALKDGDRGRAMEAFGISAGIMLSGLAGVVTIVFAELLKMVVDLATMSTKMMVDVLIGVVETIFRAFDGFLGFNAENAINNLMEFGENVKSSIDNTAGLAKSVIDTSTKMILAGLTLTAASLAQQLGISTDDFLTSATMAIAGVVKTDPDSIINTFESSFGEFGRSAASAVRSTMSDMVSVVRSYESAMSRSIRAMEYNADIYGQGPYAPRNMTQLNRTYNFSIFGGFFNRG